MPHTRPQGHYGFPPFTSANASACSLGSCSPSPDWVLSLPELLRRAAPVMRPAVVVVQWGHWHVQHAPFPQQLYEDVMRAAAEAVAPAGGRAFWQTHTPRSDAAARLPFHAPMAAAAAAAGLEVFDAFQLAAPLRTLRPNPYWDALHFYSYVYAELNNVFLNLLCPPPAAP